MIGMAAVLRARDASRRALCVSNLKQIAQALHSYQTTHGSYPLERDRVVQSIQRIMNDGVGTQGQPTDLERLERAEPFCFSISTRHHSI